MARRIAVGAAVLAAAGALAGCSVEQVNRDNLRYGANHRGTETYELNVSNGKTDSLAAGNQAATTMLSFYKGYREIATGSGPGGGEQMHTQRIADNNPGILPQYDAKYLPGGPVSGGVETIWPIEKIKDVAGRRTTTTTDAKGNAKTVEEDNEMLLRAMSSTASVAQMRDLMTEPSFPGMVPTTRTVELGCLPPPDQAGFTASGALKAILPENNGEGSFEYKTALTKLFEESERTLFLQYALYRLCEMSVNAPSGFRNVYPVVVHDIVRRTSEMRELADQANAKARVAEAELAAAQEKTKQEKLKSDQSQRRGYDDRVAECVKTKVGADPTAGKAAVTGCKSEYADLLK
ncbi:MAG: hypothetical protein ACM33T_14030 [Solirubrobacterales bacterium]